MKPHAAFKLNMMATVPVSIIIMRLIFREAYEQ